MVTAPVINAFYIDTGRQQNEVLPQNDAIIENTVVEQLHLVSAASIIDRPIDPTSQQNDAFNENADNNKMQHQLVTTPSVRTSASKKHLKRNKKQCTKVSGHDGLPQSRPVRIWPRNEFRGPQMCKCLFSFLVDCSFIVKLIIFICCIDSNSST